MRRCLFRDGKGGVLVCDCGHARMESNVFRGLAYAVRCQSSKIIMLWNEVCGCRASGVFLRLSAAGLIAENNIHSNAEAGLDIRKGANPIVLCNRIHSGQRSGIVVLGNGRGSICSNQIYGNKEAGIYILNYGHPLVKRNHIFQGQAAGVAVHENGRAQISWNVIWENQWGGVDIRRGGDPVLTNNFICHGFSDGVVVGERGRGVIEKNNIYCNRGCGVWVMSSSLPQLFRNRIAHNCAYGVAVFCSKDSAGGARGGAGGGAGYLPGRRGAGAAGHEEAELLAWESDVEGEPEYVGICGPPKISAALLETNYIGHNGAAGLYVRTSEALKVVENVLHGNKGAGVSVQQSAQLIRLAANYVCGNARTGVAVETGCQVELRGNGVYDNGGHGVSWRGDGQITENDVVGNRRGGIRLADSGGVKVFRNRVQAGRGCGIAVLARVKGQVQENVVFQSRPGCTKPLLHCDHGNGTCLLLSNTLHSCTKGSSGYADARWTLENPPPRPQLSGLFSLDMTDTSADRVTSGTSTRADSGCLGDSSLFCSIL